jgi:hypothetical protein
MENTAKNAAAPSSSKGVAQPWVRNLLAGQGFALPESVLFWWSVHLEAFLRYSRKRGPEILLEHLVADYLEGLRLDEPRVPEWRVEQIRKALEVFVRGIEQWRWETDTQGRPTPRFRLKCSLESAPADVPAGSQHLPDHRPQRSPPISAGPEMAKRQPAKYTHVMQKHGTGVKSPLDMLES